MIIIIIIIGIEIQRIWNLKCTIIPIIIGATGIVTRSLRKNLEAVPGKHSIDSLQKTAILGTSHIIRNVLQCETWSLSGGDHRWFKRSTRKKRPVTRNDNITITIIYWLLPFKYRSSFLHRVRVGSFPFLCYLNPLLFPHPVKLTRNEYCAYSEFVSHRFDVCVTVHHWYNNINSQLDATMTNFIDKYNQLTIISPILRSTRLCLQLVV